ncbi:MAG: hypothetical protein QM790_00480 [Nibricoccus sp.]
MPHSSKASLKIAAAVLSALLGFGQLRAGDVKMEESSMSPEAADKALEGKLTYNFVILKTGEIVAQDGRHFTTATAKDYLEQAKPETKAAYVFWISDSSGVDTVKALVEPFGTYGATIFLVRDVKESKKTESAPANGQEKQKSLLLVGDANPKSLTANDKLPDMSKRPEHLRPGALPRRVRYVFSPDADVLAGARKVEELFIAPKRPQTESYFEGTTLLQPGVWKHLNRVSSLKKAKTLSAKIEFQNKVIELDGKILATNGEFSTAVDALRKMIANDGGGIVRALKSAEMDFWWTFIGFDIEEPVFVLETKGGSYRFIVTMLQGHVFCIDELNALTAPLEQPPVTK